MTSPLQTALAKLTPYQGAALNCAKETKTGEFWTPYKVNDPTLARNGVLTPLGEQVRAHIRQFLVNEAAKYEDALERLKKRNG